uniref:Uncharacterized protein n=1 Tax=Arundo donax TaxID=35708 RepID=A0A0A9B3M5_ARUDO
MCTYTSLKLSKSSRIMKALYHISFQALCIGGL